MKSVKSISSELVNFLNANKCLVLLAEEDREQGNYFGASALIREYEERIEQELDLWRVDWAYAYSLGLIFDTTSFY